MMNFIEVTLCGQVESVRQATTQQGKVVVSAKVKVIKVYQQQTFESSWSIEAWGDKGAALLSCQPGYTVLVKGSLQNKKQVDANGAEKWYTNVVADTVGLVNQGQPAMQAQAPQQGYAQQAQPYSQPQQAQQRPAYVPQAPQPAQNANFNQFEQHAQQAQQQRQMNPPKNNLPNEWTDAHGQVGNLSDIPF